MHSFPASILEREIEIIIVDNGSDQETRWELKEWTRRAADSHPHIRVRLVNLEVNLGYSSGINVGLAHCQGEIIGVLNNDLVFPYNWLTALIRKLEADESIGFVAPFLSNAPSIQNTSAQFASFQELQDYAQQFTKSNRSNNIITYRVLGACILFRRDLLMKIGGNDFWFGVGNFDDDDWCMRARIAGYQVVIVGGSFVHHMRHATFQLNPSIFFMSMEANAKKFQRKWSIDTLAEAHIANICNNIVDQTTFNRDIHYIPFRLEDYKPIETQAVPSVERLSTAPTAWLLCADWINSESSWVSMLISSLKKHQPIEVTLWIPPSLFDVDLIANRIEQEISLDDPNCPIIVNKFNILRDGIAYTDVLRLVASYDAVIEVEGDFVNRYILHLARQINLKVIS